MIPKLSVVLSQFGLLFDGTGIPRKDVPQTEYDCLMAQHVFDVHKVENKMYKYMSLRQRILGSFSNFEVKAFFWLVHAQLIIDQWKTIKDYVEGTQKYKAYASDVATSSTQKRFQIDAFKSAPLPIFFIQYKLYLHFEISC